MSKPIRVTVWNEYRHEKTNEQIAQIYSRWHAQRDWKLP